MPRKQMSLKGLKSSLTRAKNSGDPDKVLEAVRKAEAIFDANYWPDCWSDWQRAKDDALMQKARRR